MNTGITRRDVAREKLARFGALAVLLLLAGLSLAGPYGVLSWGENISLLEQHERRIAKLQVERVELQNRIVLLDPDQVDPDFAAELVRRNLNVAHPEEYVLELTQQH